MVLSDIQIRRLLSAETPLLQDYAPENIGSISYDLRTKCYYDKNQAMQSCQLLPGASVYVESREIINLPDNLLARVTLRNSRIRQGLSIQAPVYQPGHKTRIHFRLTNQSNSTISIHASDSFAALIFETLETAPSQTYSGTFQEEFEFRGLGDYEPQLKGQMTELDKKVEDIRHIEKGLYANVINLMIIFIGIFSLININVNLAVSDSSDLSRLLIFNLSTVGSIAFMTCVLHTIMGSRNKKLLPVWIACVGAFALAILLFLL